MAAAEQGTIISVNPEEVRLLHDPASVCNIVDSHLECYYTVQAAVLGAMDAFTKPRGRSRPFLWPRSS